MIDAKEFTQKVWEHYLHVIAKHPFFANKLTDYTDRRLLHRLDELIEMNLAKNLTAEDVLNSKLSKMYIDFAEGNLENAKEEIYDAIAVLMRMAENIEEFYAQMRNQINEK